MKCIEFYQKTRINNLMKNNRNNDELNRSLTVY